MAVVRLILINGAPASGKSTLARRLAADPNASTPLALVLDIDIVRGLLGRWMDERGDAGILARQHALAMIDVQLRAGRDVIVPQLLARLDFILQLEAAAAALGAPFIEIALVSSPEAATERFRQRSANPEDQTHRDAAALESGTADRIPQMLAGMLAVAGQRPRTQYVETIDGDIDGTYARMLTALREGERDSA
jgi:predicted kinase